MSEDLLAYHEISDVLRKAENALADLPKEPDESTQGLVTICKALVLLQRQWHVRLGRPSVIEVPEKRTWKELLPGYIDILLACGAIGVTIGFWEAWQPLGWMSAGGFLLFLGGLAVFNRARRLRAMGRARRT